MDKKFFLLGVISIISLPAMQPNYLEACRKKLTPLPMTITIHDEAVRGASFNEKNDFTQGEIVLSPTVTPSSYNYACVTDLILPALNSNLKPMVKVIRKDGGQGAFRASLMGKIVKAPKSMRPEAQ